MFKFKIMPMFANDLLTLFLELSMNSATAAASRELMRESTVQVADEKRINLKKESSGIGVAPVLLESTARQKPFLS